MTRRSSRRRSIRRANTSWRRSYCVKFIEGGEGLHLLGASQGVMDDKALLHHYSGNGHKIVYGCLRSNAFVVWLHWIGMTHDVWFMPLLGVEGLEHAASACTRTTIHVIGETCEDCFSVP